MDRGPAIEMLYKSEDKIVELRAGIVVLVGVLKLAAQDVHNTHHLPFSGSTRLFMDCPEPGCAESARLMKKVMAL